MANTQRVRCIAHVLRHAARHSVSPTFTLFAYQNGAWKNLTITSCPVDVAEQYLTHAISGEYGHCLEIRCNGIRVSLNDVPEPHQLPSGACS